MKPGTPRKPLQIVSKFPPDISFIILTYNTKALIQECLHTLFKETEGVGKQVIVVDNGSSDNTFAWLQAQSGIESIRIDENVGFGAANNIGYSHAKGRYIALLNSDASPHSGAIQEALAFMESHPNTGLLGGRLIAKDGGWQPSARLFPSLLNEVLKETGLAHRFPKSPFFARADRRWADSETAVETDWVPGAFCLIRPEALDCDAIFDERFFMYFEEVDLCKRIKKGGWSVQYWPKCVITHLGGETCKAAAGKSFNPAGAQVSQWEARSCFLYFRKHRGLLETWGLYLFKRGFGWLRWLKNFIANGRADPKALYLAEKLEIFKQAWKETKGGTVSPKRPW